MSTSENNNVSANNYNNQPNEANDSSVYRNLSPIVSDDLTPAVSRSVEKLPFAGEGDKDESAKPVSTDPSSSRGRKRKQPCDSFDTSIAHGGMYPRRSLEHLGDWRWFPDLIRKWVREEDVPPPRAYGVNPRAPTLPSLECPLDQAFAAHVASVERELHVTRHHCNKIQSLCVDNNIIKSDIRHITRQQDERDRYHNHMARGVARLESQVSLLMMQMGETHTRLARAHDTAEAALGRANAAEARAIAAEARAEAAEARAREAEDRVDDAMDMLFAAQQEALQAEAEDEGEEEEEEEVPEEAHSDGESEASSAVL